MQVSSLKNPVIHVLRSLGEGKSCHHMVSRDFTYRTYRTYKTYQFAEFAKFAEFAPNPKKGA